MSAVGASPLTPRACVGAVALVVAGGAAAVSATSAALPALTAVARPVRDHGPAALAEVSFDVALTGGCSAVLLAAVTWLMVTTLVAVTAALSAGLAPRSRTARRIQHVSERHCPVPVRRLVAAVLGAALGLGAGVGAVPALADTHHPLPHHPLPHHPLPHHPLPHHPLPHHPLPHHPLPAGALTGLPLPDRTTGGGLAAVARRTTVGPVSPVSPVSHVQARAGSPPAVVVRPGDSLWRISARLLPAGADAAALTTAWHRLHEANRARTGPDPDLLLPGTRLTVPDRLTQPLREDPR